MSAPRPDAIDAMLKRAFATSPESSRHDCPDPALLASWYERSLARDEFSRIDTHLADCARCQSIVASITRADDALAPAPERRGWRWLLDPRLMAPAVAGVIAIIAVARVFRQPEYIAHAPVPEQIALSDQKSFASLAQREVGQKFAPGTAAENEIPSAMPAPSALPATQPSYGITAAQAVNGQIAAAPATSRANSLMAMALEQPVSTNSASGVPGLIHLASGMARVAAPHSSTTWFVGPHGLIFRREGTGPLRAEASGISTDLTDGAALSSQVCWLIGRSGTVLRTIDGEHWARLSAPTRHDLISVQAQSADSAIVVARGGLRYLTTDAGKTWNPL
ncbi:MAG TPA: hypothetical protein VJX23_17355 [Candidatus Binataceae bacterium]|nr:hypothetical protein [Candidatus Binataceae bacterium]